MMVLVPGTPPDWFIDETRIDFLERENARLRAALEQIAAAESDEELDCLDDVIGIAKAALQPKE